MKDWGNYGRPDDNMAVKQEPRNCQKDEMKRKPKRLPRREVTIIERNQ